MRLVAMWVDEYARGCQLFDDAAVEVADEGDCDGVWSFAVMEVVIGTSHNGVGLFSLVRYRVLPSGPKHIDSPCWR